MSYRIKPLIFLVLLFCFEFAFSQENHEKPKKQALHINLGGYRPLAIGNNMASKSMDQKLGTDISVILKLWGSSYLLGVEIQGFKADVKPDAGSQVGNYKKSKINRFAVKTGYIFWEKPQWAAHATASIGSVNYNNTSEHFKFKDSGTSLDIGFHLTYKFHQNFGIYTSPAYRHDFLKTKAPNAIKNYFKHQDYISLKFGVAFSF